MASYMENVAAMAIEHTMASRRKLPTAAVKRLRHGRRVTNGGLGMPFRTIAPQPPSITSLARVARVVALLCNHAAHCQLCAETFATFSGSVVDPTDAVLPAVSLLLTDTERLSRHEVSPTKRAFEFLGCLRQLCPGDHPSGFQGHAEKLTLEGKAHTVEPEARVGSLQENDCRGGRAMGRFR